jgi:hypothetical protein
LAACGGSSNSPDAGLDSGGGGSDAVSDGSGADAASADGTLAAMLTNLSGANAAVTSFVFPNLDVGNNGMQCNANTAPTLCSFYVMDNSTINTVLLQMFMDMQSFADDTSDPFNGGTSTTTGTAIAFWKEDGKRWDAGSGSFTLDHRAGGLVTFHITGQMAPNADAPGGATGTFTLDAVAQNVKFTPP